MGALKNKIDFKGLILVNNANPNGDPVNGNRPRATYDGIGEISDVCIKRKIRNRLLDMSQSIFVQSDDKRTDAFESLNDRANSIAGLKGLKDRKLYAKIACETWLDVRSFGQVFAFKGNEVSVPVRGPVSIQPAFTVSPVDIIGDQITKSVNSITGDRKSSDTMGMKFYVRHGLYVFSGSIFPQLAEKTGFTEDDAELIHRAMLSLFQGDYSEARPSGSMEVYRLYWWKHNNSIGQYPPAQVHRTVQVTPRVDFPLRIEDYNITVENLPGLEPEVSIEITA